MGEKVSMNCREMLRIDAVAKIPRHFILLLLDARVLFPSKAGV